MATSAEKKAEVQVVAAPAIEKRILVVRGRQVMLDEDLADLTASKPEYSCSRSGATRNASRWTSCSSCRPRSSVT